MSQWYYANSGHRSGPISRADLDARIAEGEVRGDTLVWRAGWDAWRRADAVVELGVPSAPAGCPVEEASSQAAEADAPESGPGEAERFAPRPARAGGRLDYAGFGPRFAAKVLDTLLLLALAQGVEAGVVQGVFDGVAPAVNDWEGTLRSLAWQASINTVIGLALLVYFLRRHEATPGKILFGLRVVRADGGRVGVGRVIGRYWAEQLNWLTFLVGYVMAAFDEQGRGLHDMLCGTRVVRGARRPDDPE